MKSKKMVFMVILVTVCAVILPAQNSRDYIKKSIVDWGRCRNVALTRQNGNVALAGGGTAAWQNVPAALDQRLQNMADEGIFIEDVQLTEGGRWLIVGDSIYWGRIEVDLENEIRRITGLGERIVSVAFNDNGDWIVLSEKNYSASNPNILNWLKTNAASYGFLRAVCITNEGMVAVYEEGFASQGKIPATCGDALGKTTLNIHRLKISGDSWFFADSNGMYQGYM